MHMLKTPDRWPAEPPAPALATLEVDKFRASFEYLCRKAEGKVPVADYILESAKAVGLDPFLLAGLVYEQSRCNPKHTSKYGFGLLQIHPDMYRSEGAPEAPVERKEWARRNLMDPKQNVSIGARLLQMWEKQHVELDEQFGGLPHRSAVSHFLWGDTVRNTGFEDVVLTARRRLIGTYSGDLEPARPTSLGVPMVCPLEGFPRVATSGPGDDRDGGARRHRGLDIIAGVGEPVRAIADGVVIFAGVNLPQAARRGPIPPDKIARYARRRLGVGGIYLCIRHGAVEKDIVSCYMHLSSYTVAQSDQVTAGQTIGVTGRTGVKHSPPHLHMEIRVNDRYMNPVRYLGDLVIPPQATTAYRHAQTAKRNRAKAAKLATEGDGA
jgi:murein DD-endopeptidase MepM/ murein hydrolase activator NlpD